MATSRAYLELVEGFGPSTTQIRERGDQWNSALLLPNSYSVVTVHSPVIETGQKSLKYFPPYSVKVSKVLLCFMLNLRNFDLQVLQPGGGEH